MKHVSKKSRRVIFFVVLGVLIGASAFFAIRAFALQSEDIFTYPPPPTPLPPNFVKPTVDYNPPHKVAERIDLAEGVPDEWKTIYLVLRPDGTYVEFVVPVGYSGDRRELMGLAPNEKIVNKYPFDPMFLQSTPIITEPPLVSETPTPTALPYPTPHPTPASTNLSSP